MVSATNARSTNDGPTPSKRSSAATPPPPPPPTPTPTPPPARREFRGNPTEETGEATGKEADKASAGQQGFDFAAGNDDDDEADGTGVAPVPPPPNNTQLLVIANLDLLRKLIGGGTLPDGTPLPADTITKMACDAEIVPAVFDTDGQPLWLGRTVRLATPTQRIAVTARDHGCIVCHAAPEYCQVHHIDWWSNGGTTDLDNLCLVCSRHHAMVHEHDLTIIKTPNGMKVQPRRVRSVPDPPPRSDRSPPDTTRQRQSRSDRHGPTHTAA